MLTCVFVLKVVVAFCLRYDFLVDCRFKDIRQGQRDFLIWQSFSCTLYMKQIVPKVRTLPTKHIPLTQNRAENTFFLLTVKYP